MKHSGAHRRHARTFIPVAALGALALVLATGSASSGAEPITPANVNPNLFKVAVRKATLGDVPVKELDPVVAQTLAIATTPLTDEQQALWKTCMTSSSCVTGHGTLTVAINADFSDNPWWNIRRGEAIAQAIATPEVAKILFVSSESGSVGEVLANLRSLIAQRVNIIVEDPIFGAAVLPALEEAKKAGVIFVTENSPLPAELNDVVSAQAPLDLCPMGSVAGQLVSTNADTALPKTYALFTGVEGNAHAAEWQGCVQKKMDAAGWKGVYSGYTQWTPQGEAQAAAALVASGKEIGAIFYDSVLNDFLQPYIDKGKQLPAAFSDTHQYSTWGLYDKALHAGLKPQLYAANSHVWYGRLGVTAGVMLATGHHVPKTILSPVPTGRFGDLADLNVAEMPGQTAFATLLTVDQAKFALSH